MGLQEKIQEDLSSALKARETLRLDVLRMVKAALTNKQIEKRATLTEGEVLAVLRTSVKQRKESAEQFRKGGRTELAEKEENEIEIIKTYLPAPASDKEIETAIDSAISEIGAAGPKTMGAVMKATMTLLSGKTIDGAKVSSLVRAKLQ